ncbi:chromodomain-helicase-DNA-binding protein 8-like isoform X1 [Pristis pectinata]|uniref:chromodomain-helicase-DNA-binding protein 8-like isoform X1 n=1 Tax=Pristis pectinata TaxID=685728 RepID=UPI00223D86FE|nr:chromodomain-helicase-DNA-binding protein 8-like isoform X1 [Pristis pectinata]
MADPIMDLFDDPGLFAEGLDSLTAGSIADDLDLGDGFETLEPGPELSKAHSFDGLPPFQQTPSDGTPQQTPYAIFPGLKSPVRTFDGHSPLWAQPPPEESITQPAAAQEPEYLVHHDYALQQSEQETPAPAPSPPSSPSPSPAQPALHPFSQAPEPISQGNPFMGVHDSQQQSPAAVNKSLPPPPPPPPPPTLPAPLPSPSPSSTTTTTSVPVEATAQGLETAQPQTSASFPAPGQQPVSSSSSPVQYNIRYTLPGQSVPNGGVVIPQGTVLASSQAVSYLPGSTIFTTATGVSQPQESQSNGTPLGQVLLQPVTAQQSAASFTTATLTSVKPNVTIAPSPVSQGDPKRITLVLQQPPGSAQPGQRHVMMRTLPGKILIQGQQLTALAHGQAAKGQAGKVVTIQLQLQNPQQKLQPCQMFLQQPVAVATTAATQPQPQAVRQQPQGQRLTVPLQVSLQQPVQPQVSVPTVSVVTAQVTGVVNEQQRKLEHQKKQEKANRIVAEAIARAKARGEQNIPRVLAHGELSGKALGSEAEDKKRKKKAASRPKEADGKKSRSSSSSKAGSSSSAKGKGKSKLSTITPVIGKKRKKTGSSEENSDVERSPAQSSKDDEETATQKRRSNRQVKRKKYTEDLDLKITDDEDEEVDVMGPVKMPPIIDVDTSLQTMQLFVENPSEEDAAIVDKILSFRVAKKEVYAGQYVEVEEFYVKYKNYSYLHCEWANLQQLEKDKRIHQKIKRFKAKMAQMRHIFHEDEDPFNPDYIEVDRLLEESHSVDKDNGEPVVYYLVKWCSLPYEDSTWELKEDVDEAKIEEFERLQARKPRLAHVERPPAKAWKKLDLFREYKNNNQLREYQLEGVNWLLFNWYNRQNCILADEMGLGKTIQSITFLEEVYSAGIQGPFLVIAPLSTITNWEREFSTWTDMNAIVYHGSLVSRQMIQQYEMYFRDSKGHFIPGAYRFDALITTFEMILSDCPELREIAWRCVIIDEAHRLKNRNCKLLEGLKLMELEHKVLLTGTPLQNTVEELFSLLNFLEPSQFPLESAFLQEFGDLKTEEQVQKLQALLKPMMLRRLKEDVEKNLAPKEETIIEVELTNIQKKYYRAILERNFTFLAKGAGQANVPNLLNTMMELRKCCNHPYLINGAEEKILGEFREIHDPTALDFHLQAMIQSAGKLVLIDKLLPKLKAGGHKVLIFSQMVRCLDILEDYLIQKRYLYERIDGRVRGNLRQAAIDRFSKPDSDRFVFLLCTRAGGLGINLTAADTCIIFDSDWNPQNDLQAQARCHRIGQSKAVKVYRLITRNSYEREMFDKASLKLGLDKAVLQSMSGRENNVNGIQQFSKKEIEDLLRKGAYGAIMDEEDEGSKFCEEDIDQILSRRTTTITIETEGKGSTFAKASFVATGNRTDISLDDPNFWQKWAKKADIDLDMVNRRNNLVIDTPRVRKQTRPFNTTKDDDVEFSEMDSDSDERPKSRRSHERRHGYGRTECFRVEKNLLVYGWGRWKDILAHGRFKRRMMERDVEVICRTILVYCLLHYRGDEKIKGFIWDLITPTENGQTKELQNHSGLSAPVPRGRKGKKVKSQSSSFDVQKADWIRKCNPDILLQDDSYKKHLKHHCNKVLLRVRMLYYLKQEVIGDQSDRVLDGADTNDIDVWIPEVDGMEVPAEWWDVEADKSLLIGVFKHGYEKYNTMRADPALCFLEQVGRPDEKAIAAEQRGTDMFGDLGDGGDFDRDLEDPEYKPIILGREHREDDADGMAMDEDISVDGDDGETRKDVLMGFHSQCRYWPTPSVLTARLRRLVTAYQRSYKQEQQKMEAAEKGDRKRRRCEAAFKLKEIARRERQQKWTGREESDFYRVVSTFGVEFDPHTRRYQWDRFRAIAHLERKTDETLTRYLQMFMAMCRRVCGLPLEEGEEYPDMSLLVKQVTEERATRTLYRIELLRRVREEVLCHPQLQEHLRLCQPSPELPDWWECGRHDLELLQGVARHGLSRTDAHLLTDPRLSFRACRRSQQPGSRCSTPSHPPSPLRPPPACCSGAGAEGRGDCSPFRPGSLFGKGPAGPGDWERESDSELDKSSLADSCPSSSEESDGDKDPDDKPCSEAPSHSKTYDEESMISVNTSRDETLDCFLNDELETGLGDLLQDKQQLPAPGWPKDRVLINRIDMVCHTVLTGCWPTPRRAQCEPAVRLPACPDTPSLMESPGESPVPTPGSLTIDEDTASAQFTKVKKHIREKEFTVKINNEDGLKLTFHKQHRRRRRRLDMGDEGSRGRPLAPGLRDSQSASDSGPETGAECPRTAPLTPSALLDHGFPLKGPGEREGGSPNPHTIRCQLDAVLSAGNSPLWRHSVNGQLAGAHNLGKKRRGRQKNVDRIELMQQSPGQGLCTANGEGERTLEDPQPRRAELDMDTRIPVVSKLDGTVLAGDEAPRRRELDHWLKLHPDFAVDPSCLAFVEDRPKQKRHRCRNPHKLDVNALTGDERVPVINRRNGKKLGGGFAPPIRDLQKWLQENTEYGVAQEWADVIKQSGYLAEDMFDRILTGPVVPEEGRKRGRRPKHLAAAMQVNSLLASGVLDAGSLQSLQKNLHSLQLAGLMGYPGAGQAGDPGSGLPLGPSAAPAAAESQAGPQEPSPGSALTLSPLVLSGMYGGGMYLPQGFGVGVPELTLGGLEQAKTLGARGSPFPAGGHPAEAADDLSQGYDSTDDKTDFCHSLIDDPMMPTNSDLSGDD